MAKEDEVHDLSSLLDVIEEKIDEDGSSDASDSIRMEELLNVIGRRAYGPLLLIIGLISISPAALIPFSTIILATVILLIAIQLVFHKETPWLPEAALNMKLEEKKLYGFIRFSRPAARWVDKFIRPRWTFLSEPPWVMIVALLVVAAALLTYPLSLIPIAPLLPGLAVSFFGLGMTARDGVLLTIGAVIMGAGCAVGITRLV